MYSLDQIAKANANSVSKPQAAKMEVDRHRNCNDLIMRLSAWRSVLHFPHIFYTSQ